MDGQRPEGVAVVVLVTSAGGLDALTAVLTRLPQDLRAAVVVQQHLGGHGSQLVPILARRTAHDIAWAQDGDPLTPGRVLVAPARRRLEVLPDGTCAVGPPVRMDARDRPHDMVLTSLADSYGSRALAVVLTGMGTDGSAGVSAVRAAGGIVIAQSEDTAEQPSMPRAAAGAGADLVLPLHEIGPVIADVVRGAPLPRTNEESAAIRATFGETGRIAALARDLDWSLTPVGRVSEWPAVLRTTLRLAMDCPDPTAVTWGPDHLLFVNEAAIGPLSGRHEHAFARPHREALPEIWDTMAPLLAETLEGGRPRVPAAYLPFERNGRLEDAWFDLSHTPVRDADGTVVGVFESFFDRTCEVLAQRRLGTLNRLSGTPVADSRRAAAAAVLSVLADAADVHFAAVYLLDASGTRAGLAGTAGVDEGGPLAPRELRLAAGSVWPLSRALAGDPVLVGDLESRFRGNLVGTRQLAPGTALLHPLRDPAEDRVAGVLILGTHPRLPLDERYREFLGLAGDAVSAKVAESHARHREHERLERAAELDRAKTEFFSNISHEFRTPLTLLLAPLEETLRRSAELPPGVAVELEMAQRNARRLLRLVGTLLDFSQLEAGRLRARFLPTDLPALTGEIVSMFRGAADTAGLALTVDAEPLPKPIWVDPEMWEKVVSNLVSNALKYTWSGSVAVSLRRLPKHVELVVRDTGVGIPAAQLPHVFTRFHRVPGARGRTHEGAGIGLALVDELVRRHHGRIRVTSTERQGTAFTVWLPLGRRPADESDPAAVRTGAVAAAMAAEATRWDAAQERQHAALGLDDEVPGGQWPAAWNGEARVLVVDDNPDMRNYLVRLLGGGWRVIAATDGTRALAEARRERPDLVLADVMMPNLDGFGLLKAVRADERLADVPVVLLTARAGEEAAVEGLLAGADDYVVKPFSARELVARVAAQLELARQRRRTDARWRAIVDSSFDVVYRMSPDWSELRGLTGHGFLDDTSEPTTSWLDHYIDPDDQARVLRAIEEAVRTRGVFELEHRVRRPDGSLGWTLSRAVPLLDEDGRVEEWVGTASDVTDRRQQEEDRRRDEEAAFRVLVELGGQRVWTTGPDGTAPPWLDDVHPDDRAAAARCWTGSVRAVTPFDRRLRLSAGPARIRAVPLRHPDGTVRGWLGLITALPA